MSHLRSVVIGLMVKRACPSLVLPDGTERLVPGLGLEPSGHQGGVRAALGHLGEGGGDGGGGRGRGGRGKITL